MCLGCPHKFVKHKLSTPPPFFSYVFVRTWSYFQASFLALLLLLGVLQLISSAAVALIATVFLVPSKLEFQNQPSNSIVYFSHRTLTRNFSKKCSCFSYRFLSATFFFFLLKLDNQKLCLPFFFLPIIISDQLESHAFRKHCLLPSQCIVWLYRSPSFLTELRMWLPN